ncbi:MAG: phosphatase [Bacteroidetes bacterium]|nr:MAG: phosphatase [Bacteroidota bacterium]
MRKAVIDLGTNTFHLVVAEVHDEHISEIVHREQIAVKLGEGGINQGRIAEAAYERGLNALARFKTKLDEMGLGKCRCLATSAIRSAANGSEFMAEVKSRYGLEIEIISGDQEAEYIQKGVDATLPLDFPAHLVMDIGGGSVEFIIVDAGEILWKQSFDVGCARLLEKFHQHDPITDAEVNSLFDYLDDQLKPLHEAMQLHQVTCLVGSAGSFESLLELMDDQLDIRIPESHPGLYELDPDDFFELSDILTASTLEERLAMKGLADYRVEMMVVASLLIDYVMETFLLESIFCSMNSLKEGVLLS